TRVLLPCNGPMKCHSSGRPGSARIFGKDVVTQGPEIRRDIGYLPSEVFYYEGMKVRDLLKYSASFYEGDCTQRMNELSEIMELELNRRISDLSYGNKKKVGIIQGLAHEPKLIILDEPNSALNERETQRLFAVLRSLREREDFPPFHLSPLSRLTTNDS
ncbi:MAG: hypothetical protein CVV20_04320, partial [Gemmatimonadetes bacterium HGW-Gemmatimonadetes-1]